MTTDDTGSNTAVYDEFTGNITNNGSLSVQGLTVWNNHGDTFINSGTISVAANVSFYVEFGQFDQDGGALDGGGTVNFAATNGLGGYSPTDFDVEANYSDGAVTLLFSSNIINGSATFTNVAGNTLNLQNSSLSCPFDNLGILLEEDASATISGQLTTGSNSTIELISNTTGNAFLTLSNAFTNDGTIDLTDDNNTTANNYYSGLTVSSGALTNASSGTITTTDDTGSNTSVYDEFTGNITNDGSLTVQGLTVWNNHGDTFVNAGTVSVPENATFYVEFGQFDLDGGTLTGGGTVNFATTSGLGGYSPTTLDVEENFSDGGVSLAFNSNIIEGSATFTNVVGNTFDPNQCTISAPFDNLGTLLLQVTGATISGQLTAAANSTIELVSNTTGNAYLTISNAFSNDGAIDLVDDDNTTANNYYSSLTISSGALTNDSDGTITTTDDTGSNTSAYDEFTGNITNNGSLSVQGLTVWNNHGDTFINSGTISVAANVSFYVEFGQFDEDGGALDGGGTVNFAATSGLGGYSPTDFDVEANYSDGGVTLLFSSNIINGSATFTNVAGYILALNQVNIECSFVNDGTLEDGEYYATISGQLTTGANSTIQITASATGSAGLLISSAFTNDGTIDVADDDTSSSAEYDAYLTISSGTMINGFTGKLATSASAGVNASVYAEIQGSIDNEGAIDIDATALFQNGGDTLTNLGTIDVAAGLTIDDVFPQTAGLLDFLGGEIFGSFSLGGGSIEGSGEISGTLSVPADDVGVIAVNSGMVTAGAVSIGTGGSLNVGNNELMINYGTGADPMATIYGYLKSGYNNGGWNGSGIFSTAAQTPTDGLKYGLGYSDGKDGVVSGLISGEIEVKYTLVGDANLDGTVNGSDFSIMAAHFGEGVTNWDEGNFLYGTSVNGSDFSALAANFGQGDSGVAVAGAETTNDPLNVEVNTEVNVGQDIVGMTSRIVLALCERAEQ